MDTYSPIHLLTHSPQKTLRVFGFEALESCGQVMKGRTGDVLALTGDEERGNLRKARGS